MWHAARVWTFFGYHRGDECLDASGAEILCWTMIPWRNGADFPIRFTESDVFFFFFIIKKNWGWFEKTKECRQVSSFWIGHLCQHWRVFFLRVLKKKKEKPVRALIASLTTGRTRMGRSTSSISVHMFCFSWEAGSLISEDVGGKEW